MCMEDVRPHKIPERGERSEDRELGPMKNRFRPQIRGHSQGTVRGTNKKFEV